MFVVAGVVLLLACGNLANLLLVRGIARAPELAIREALGGDRGQIGRPLLIEALLLSAVGGALGLAAAIWLQGIISTVPLPPTNSVLDVRFDYRMVVFSVLAALGTGCLFGLLPSWRSASTNVATTLRDAGRTQSSASSTSLLRSALVAGQVALSVVLVAATALLARSFVNAERVDPGVDAERIAVIGTNLLQGGVTLQDAGVVATQILERIEALPGVESAALTTRLPLSVGSTSSTVVEGYELPSGASAIEMPISATSPNYFSTMGIRLLAGRDFTATDRPSSPPVVIVSETAARLYFGGDAVGRRVRPQDDPEAWREVVGVVADVKVTELQEPPTPLMYFSSRANEPGRLLGRRADAGDPAALLGALPAALRDVRASLPVTRIEPFEAHLAGALEAARTSALFMGAFAALALVLAGLGIYAAVSFSVGLRAQEIGIRVALGATAPRLIRMVVTATLRLVCIGVFVGLVLAMLAAQGMQSVLFGVAPLDGVSFAGAALLLIGAARSGGVRAGSTSLCARTRPTCCAVSNNARGGQSGGRVVHGPRNRVASFDGAAAAQLLRRAPSTRAPTRHRPSNRRARPWANARLSTRGSRRRARPGIRRGRSSRRAAADRLAAREQRAERQVHDGRQHRMAARKAARVHDLPVRDEVRPRPIETELQQRAGEVPLATAASR